MAVKIEDFGGNVLWTASDQEYLTARENASDDGRIKMASGSVVLDFWCYEYSEANKDTLLSELVSAHGATGDDNHFLVARPSGVE